MIKLKFKPIFLSIENSSKLCSISLSNGYIYFYKEIIGINIKSEYILKIINNILIENNISLKKIDLIVFGDGLTNFTNTRMIFSIIQGLTLGWKLPIIKISSISAIAIEAFYRYKKKRIFIALDGKMNKLCYKLYNKNTDFFLNDFDYHIKKISKIILPQKKILGIVDTSCSNIHILKNNNPFLEIKKNIFPKSLYIDLLARKIFLTGNIKLPTKIKPNYMIKILYKKYQL